MTGKQFVDRLIKQQEDRYYKRIPYEKGLYHQCIPHPKKEDQLITLQLVTRVLAGKKETDDEHYEFDQD